MRLGLGLGLGLALALALALTWWLVAASSICPRAWCA